MLGRDDNEQLESERVCRLDRQKIPFEIEVRGFCLIKYWEKKGLKQEKILKLINNHNLNHKCFNDVSVQRTSGMNSIELLSSA